MIIEYCQHCFGYTERSTVKKFHPCICYKKCNICDQMNQHRIGYIICRCVYCYSCDVGAATMYQCKKCKQRKWTCTSSNNNQHQETRKTIS